MLDRVSEDSVSDNGDGDLGIVVVAWVMVFVLLRGTKRPYSRG